MMKQKFYEYVDKYLMAMGFDLNKYEDLHEQTIRELALDTAKAGMRCLEAAWDLDEMNEELGEGYMYALDPDDPTIGEGLKEACRKDEEREFWENEERFMCRNILAKILLSCDPSTLTKAQLDCREKEFLIAYDFRQFCFRDAAKYGLVES